MKPNIHKVQNLRFPLGSNDFTNLVSSDVFVDKSLFIQEILESSEEAILITRPRRWGKTLSMKMLQHFFAPTDNEHTRIMFSKLKIANETAHVIDHEQKKHVNILEEFHGKYPVIFISFKDARGTEYAEWLQRPDK